MGNSAIKGGKKDIRAMRILAKDIPDTREDILTARRLTEEFSTSQTLVEEDLPEAQTKEEEIIIKCSLEQITKSFFQDYIIIWHDPSINSQENQQYIAQLKKFCDVLTFTEWQKAKDFIKSSSVACHVITSGTNGELLVKEICLRQNVAKIYVFCGNKDYHLIWAKNYDKVSCIETQVEDLLSRIQQNLLEWYKQASSLKLNLPAFAPIFNDSDKSQMNNLHRFLKVIPNFQNRKQAKNDFLNLSKAIYSDPQNTKFIADFEKHYNTYDKEQTLRWYSQESFLYKVTNNCLRIATSDSIQYCRLLLQDIQKAIKEQYQTKSKNFSGLLYRGAYLSQEEWSSLKANLNGEIEMHGFLSVTKVKNIGLNFMKTDPSKKALITIIVPRGPNEEEQGFAEMQEFSEYPQEKEILFNVRSRFTILETEDEDSQDEPYRHLVLLYGAQGFRKYLTEQNSLIEVPVPSLENVSCSQCKATNPERTFFISLIEPQKQIYYCQSCIDHKLSSFLCIPLIKNEPYTIKVSGCLLINSHTPELRFYGYRCSKCQAKKHEQYFFTCTDCNVQWCQSCFSESPNNCTQALHPVVLETSPFTLWYRKMSPAELNHLKFQNDFVTNNKNHIFQQALMYFDSLDYEKAIKYFSIYIQQNEPKGKDQKLANSYLNLGLTYEHQGEHTKALEYYFKALPIFKSLYGDSHADIATCFCYVANAFHKQGEFPQALEYYLKSLDMNKSIYGEQHRIVAVSYNNIGLLYNKQGEYKKALEYYLKSLDICKSVYGKKHPAVAVSYNNIGSLHDFQGEYKKALEYYFKSLEIAKDIYGEKHPHVALPYNNIGRIYNSQGDSKKALEYCFKSLDISKSVYGEKHPNIVMSNSNIGLAYNQLGEYKKALEYYFKSLDISKSVYGEKHPDIAAICNNIGEVCFNQAEYKKALEYHFKSLEISKSVYGNNHPDIATSYNNIGLTFAQQGEYKKAFEYYKESLDIRKSVYGDHHPTIAISYNNIGQVYNQQGECNKALEYYFNSLDISKSVYGDHHPTIAVSYYNIGMAFHRQRENKKALEYYLKSVDISKSAYGENHPSVALSYNNIGVLSFNQGDYKKALEYYFKSLDINRSVYGESHPEIANNYTNIGCVLHKKGENKKSLEYYEKALNIIKLVYGHNHPKTIETQKGILEIRSAPSLD